MILILQNRAELGRISLDQQQRANAILVLNGDDTFTVEKHRHLPGWRGVHPLHRLAEVTVFPLPEDAPRKRPLHLSPGMPMR
jgi:hypothetical protein